MARQGSFGARCDTLQDLIFECYAFGVILREPCFSGSTFANTLR
jgi:hypothetical protein